MYDTLNGREMASAALFAVILSLGLWIAPARAATEFSGDIAMARKAYPQLKQIFCSKSSPKLTCDLDEVRVIGNWAYYGWLQGEMGGTGLARWNGKTWQPLASGGGVLDSAEAVRHGIPATAARTLV